MASALIGVCGGGERWEISLRTTFLYCMQGLPEKSRGVEGAYLLRIETNFS